MKITFVGEAVSGFGGMETVIKNVISTLQTKSQPDECSVFFFVEMIKWIKIGCVELMSNTLSPGKNFLFKTDETSF